MASSSRVTLDDLAPPTPRHPPIDNHLFYPTVEEKESQNEREASPFEPTRQVLKDRLYIGNLHPSVDEFTLLQVFSKFGKVTKMDFLFHKTGLLKGKPRGYAFIEYGNKDDALKALNMAHEKPLRGRKLTVTFAHQAPLDQYSGVGASASLKGRKTLMETGRPTTLSMLKTGLRNRHEGKTEDKIAMMEAKLRQMESTNPKPKATPPPPGVDMDDLSLSQSRPSTPISSSLPYHPSLPMKPPPQLPVGQSGNSGAQLMAKPKKIPMALPSLPILPPSLLAHSSSSRGSEAIQKASFNSLSSVSTGSGTHRTAKSSKLVGVKIKPKEKEGPHS